MPESAYDRMRRERCPDGCGKGLPFAPDNRVGAGFHFDAAMKFDSCSVNKRFIQCTASSREVWAEELAQENSEMAKMLAEPPESALRIKELAVQLETARTALIEISDHGGEWSSQHAIHALAVLEKRDA